MLTCYVYRFFFVKELEKEEKKRNPESGRWGEVMKMAMWKQKRSDLENKIEKKMKQRWTKKVVKIMKKMIKGFWKWFSKQR